MLFQLDITGTEEDYLAFNIFHSLESSQAQKIVNKRRNVFVAAMIGLMVLLVLITGWTTFSTIYVIIVGLYTILYILLFKKIIRRNIKAGIKRMKQDGKLPFDPISKMEFYEDKLVEITASTRIEQSYDALERICVVSDRYIFLYFSSVQGHILPLPQVRKQLVEEDFLNFLAKKCTHIEHY